VIARLLDAQDEGVDIPDDKVLSLCMLTLSAGIDTTAALVGTSLIMIARDDQLRRRLIEDPDLVRPAFQEFLRLSTPTSGLVRTAMSDTELGGQKIRRGERVMLCFAAASRDPREFEDPDQFRFGRRANRHTGFGSGIHRCIGAHYAELEFELMLSTILRRMPDFRIDTENMEKYHNIGIVDGWISIPATFTPGPRLKSA
jgi:cytochrome P450